MEPLFRTRPVRLRGLGLCRLDMEWAWSGKEYNGGF